MEFLHFGFWVVFNLKGELLYIKFCLILLFFDFAYDII